MSTMQSYFDAVAKIANSLDVPLVEKLVDALVQLRDRGGRLFLLGVGGSAANCSHAACDFRKITRIQAYAPTDNVAELTARINDEGWDVAFSSWLEASRATPNDAVMVFSVGGGDLERNVSTNLVRALQWAKERSIPIFGIVGRDGGFTKQIGDLVVVVPVVDPQKVTAHAEAFQAVVWHGLVSHPRLQAQSMHWEHVAGQR